MNKNNEHIHNQLWNISAYISPKHVSLNMSTFPYLTCLHVNIPYLIPFPVLLNLYLCMTQGNSILSSLTKTQ